MGWNHSLAVTVLGVALLVVAAVALAAVVEMARNAVLAKRRRPMHREVDELARRRKNNGKSA